MSYSSGSPLRSGTTLGPGTRTSGSPLVTAIMTVGVDGQLYYWSGSVWVKRPVKVWSGATWVVKPVKRWTGSVWELV
jgi:hypothetical protein